MSEEIIEETQQEPAYKKIQERAETAPDSSVFSKFEGYDYLFSPDWLEKGHTPLCLDIGAGMGRFLMGMAETYPERRFIGIDPDYQCIKKNLQKCKNREKRDVKIEHVRLFYGSVYHFFPHLKKESVSIAYVNYPDPWFKRRHLKRRLVKEELFNTLHPLLKPGAEVFVQTDIDDYAHFIDEELKKVKGFDIQYEAISLFKDFPTTLYQEKAEKKDHSRFCYYLKKVES